MARFCVQPLIAAAGVDRPGHHDQAAALVGDPFFQQFDLLGAEGLPVGIEGHDAIVIVHVFAGGGEFVEDFSLLRHAFPAGLQEHVQRGRAIAIQLRAEEVIIAHRPAGQQQDVILAIDDFDVGLAEVVGRILVAGRILDAETDGAAAEFVGRQFELDRHHFAVAAERDLPGIEHLARAFIGGPGSGGTRKNLHRDHLARHVPGLEIAGHRVAVARICPGRHGQIADAHVGRLACRNPVPR